MSPEEYEAKMRTDPDGFYMSPSWGLSYWFASRSLYAFLFFMVCGLLNIFLFLVQQKVDLTIFIGIGGVIAFIMLEYISGADRHLPYFKEFDKLSRGKKCLLGWVCSCMLIGACVFLFVTSTLTIHTLLFTNGANVLDFPAAVPPPLSVVSRLRI